MPQEIQPLPNLIQKSMYLHNLFSLLCLLTKHTKEKTMDKIVVKEIKKRGERRGKTNN
jgi:hypothetical protein